MKKQYQVILADPPWSFRVWNADTGSGRSAESHYRTMDIQAICDLPIRSLAADNCALFLWCVWPSIFEYAPRVMEAWGFRYATKAWTWVKSNSDGHGVHMGMGYYTRANDEPCLLAVKGEMPVAVHDELALIYAPIREHSQKPEEQYRKIERLYPSCSYLELFARNRRPNWDCIWKVSDWVDVKASQA